MCKAGWLELIKNKKQTDKELINGITLDINLTVNWPKSITKIHLLLLLFQIMNLVKLLIRFQISVFFHCDIFPTILDCSFASHPLTCLLSDVSLRYQQLAVVVSALHLSASSCTRHLCLHLFPVTKHHKALSTLLLALGRRSVNCEILTNPT